MSEVIANFLDDNGYDLATMTNAVNIIPNKYGRIQQMGLFVRKGETTQRVVIIDIVKGRLTLLPSVPVNGPATQAKRGGRNSIPFIIPHIPYSDFIYPSDIQGKREAGSLNPKTVETVVYNRLESMKNNHAITYEYLLMGALKGKILDADGEEIEDLFKRFKKTQKKVTFDFETEGSFKKQCGTIVRHIEDTIQGDTMSGVHCFCDQTFFEKMIGSPDVEKYFLGHEKAIELAGIDSDPRKGFKIFGITFEENRAKASKPNGTIVPFIKEGGAHFFPVGTTSQTYETFDAPADYFETVNTPGLPLYAKQVPEADGKSIKILTESNPLPLCKRPEVLVQGA